MIGAGDLYELRLKLMSEVDKLLPIWEAALNNYERYGYNGADVEEGYEAVKVEIRRLLDEEG